MKVSDVADVIDDWEEEISYARSNNVPSVMVAVQKQSRTNTVEVTDGVMEVMERLQRSDLPNDVKVDVIRTSRSI